MEHWPGHERQEKTKVTDNSKDKGKQKVHLPESSLWQWPQLEHGLTGRITLVSKDGGVQYSHVVDTSHGRRWLPLGRPAKAFPETCSPQANTQEHSARKRTKEGLHYLRTLFPDADFPGELLWNTLKSEIDCSTAFDPFLGNRLATISSHRTRNESIVVFPMGELGRELNISRIGFDSSRNMVFTPSGSPSFAFETPILQVSSTVEPSDWIAAPYRTFLIRTHTSSSLCHLQGSKVTRKLDITRSETGDVPIMDSRILASGPDIVLVNRNGKIYKCNTNNGGKLMQLIGAHEVSAENDFWQLGITARDDECFLASCKVVKHVDLRSADAFADVFFLDHPSAIVTSFESPMHDHISRITTTSDVIWLDDRSRRRPLLSYKHYRNFDRTLRLLTADLRDASLSLLTSRTNGLVTVYDVGRGSDKLLHCNSVPSCLPQGGPIFTAFDGQALIVPPLREELTFLRLCQRGSIYGQDVRVTRPDEDGLEPVQEKHVAHQWDEDVQELAMQVDELRTDFGPAGGRYYVEVNLRSAYETMFTIADNSAEDKNGNTFEVTVPRLLEVWNELEETAESMLTTFDIISAAEDGNEYATQTDFFTRGNFNAKQAFDTLMSGQLPTQALGNLARWHYNIQETTIPTADDDSVDYNALHERLKKLNLVSEAGRHDSSVQRETEARERLVLDLAFSNDVYSARPIALPSISGGQTTVNAMPPLGISYDEEPPEIKFGYFLPVRKASANHYANKMEDDEQDARVPSPLGVRLLLTEWELGTDPKDYTYRDPYGVADIDTQPIPQYRRLPSAPPTTQKKQIQPQRPPPVVAVASTQPPAVHTTERHQGQITHSQQQFESSVDAFSQEPMTSTQVLPGPFGGRPGAGKKPVKKRMGGF